MSDMPCILLQVLPGGDEPAHLRQALKQALLRSPAAPQQMVKDPDMLHTTIARLLAPVKWPTALRRDTITASKMQQVSSVYMDTYQVVHKRHVAKGSSCWVHTLLCRCRGRHHA